MRNLERITLSLTNFSIIFIDYGSNWEILGGSGKFRLTMLPSSSNIYAGKHRRNPDEKGRVLLPAKWGFGADKNEVDIAIPNPSGCIIVCPPKMVDKLRDKASNISIGDKKGEKTLTKLFSKADQLICNAQGRMLLNQMLWEHGGFTKEVRMVGNFVTFSIWDPKRYEQSLDRDDEEDDEIRKIVPQIGL
jgi:MraZ protein